MVSITTKLEIDVMQANELVPAIELACKHVMPAIVVHQSLIPQAAIQRIKSKGRFKIIAPIDWPKGDNFSMLKLRGITSNTLGADGFEILLTGGKNEIETRNEASTLTDFIYDTVNRDAEVRFLLGTQMRSDEEIMRICHGLVGVRSPTMIRVDHHLKVQVTKGNVEAQTAHAARIKEVIAYPLKACGNFTTAKAVASCTWAHRVAVGLNQAQQILRELSRNPDGLRDILNQ